MEYYWIAFVGVLFCTTVMVKETRSIRERSSIFLINIFGYMYGVIYGLLPACVFTAYAIGEIDISHDYYIIDYSSVGVSQITLWMFLGIVGYLIVQFSYKHRFCFHRSTCESYEQKQYTTNDLSQTDMQRVYNTLQVTMIICFIISAISLF